VEPTAEVFELQASDARAAQVVAIFQFAERLRLHFENADQRPLELCDSQFGPGAEPRRGIWKACCGTSVSKEQAAQHVGFWRRVFEISKRLCKNEDEETRALLATVGISPGGLNDWHWQRFLELGSN
jgi:hypothetical protein